jgi:trehalose synthase
MREVPIPPVPVQPYHKVFGDDRMTSLRAAADRVGALLRGRTVWNVNSTDTGGGVAELLRSLLPLARAGGVDVRWLVIEGDQEFCTIAKRLCVWIYGSAGDDGELGPAQRRHFRRSTEANADELAKRIRPGDIVIVHDPQPAGLIEFVRARGAKVVWRCHIGSDEPNGHTRDGWAFLRPFVEHADVTVFGTERHVPAWAPCPQIISPSIDPCSPKNAPLAAETVTSVLAAIGVLSGPGQRPITVPVPMGEPVVIRRPAQIIRDGPVPPATMPMVLQVSRWDPLKDMAGVLRAFVAAGDVAAHLVLAGADVSSIADDPQASAPLDECRRVWAALPSEHRRRVQLVCLPMADLRENALMVNALQRHAAVVVQKSLAEGFGLTATEALWKARPMLASAVGGLRDQVVDGECGVVLDDPANLTEAATGIRTLLSDREYADRLGGNARRRVAQRFLPDQHLLAWARTLEICGTAEVA